MHSQTGSGPRPQAGPLEIDRFQIDRDEHQIEPEDRADATYWIRNTSAFFELSEIELVHFERTNTDGAVVLSWEPSSVLVPGVLGPQQERQISVELVTRGELPGRHAVRVQATFESRPVSLPVDGLLEVTVTAD